MSNSKERAPLFSEFPPVSTEEWEKVIKRDLKGADYREKLRWETGEGIEALPFYRAEDLDTIELPPKLPLLNDQNNEWKICEPIFDQDIYAANKSARQALDRGADDLRFKLHVLATAGMLGGDLDGTSIQSQQDFNHLFGDVDIARTGLHFDSGMASPVLLAMLHNACKDRKIETDAVRSTLLYDPYTFIIVNGQYPKPEEEFVREARQMTAFCHKILPGVRCLGVDARTYHNAGATIVQELGYALAIGNEYLAKLTDAGLTADEIAPHIYFNFAIGSNYFLEIAKFRAVRILWETVVEAYEPKNTASSVMYLHGRSSDWNKTIFDAHTNMLRTTTEGMSGAIAGCDVITLDPFDRTYKRPDEFSRRIARNTQIILKKEAYFDKVSDPSAGSYYLEVLTDKIANAAWECFREIEQQGGILKALRGGYIQTAMEESREQHDRAIAERGRVFVGANKYANAEEIMSPELGSGFSTVSLKASEKVADIDKDELMESLSNVLNDGASLGDLIPALQEIGKHDIRPIRLYRGPRAFEELRLVTERNNVTPKVLTLPMGDKKLRKARSAFAVNFFSCAGYDIKDPVGFESVEQSMEAVKEHQPDVVVLCSSDREYKQLVPEICKELNKLESKPTVVIAGYPEKEIEQYQSAGVDAFIHRGSNMLDSLKWFQQRLGIGTEKAGVL